ncbi:hypothetical protein A5320_10400 [Rheinheimera sp. SA_1]|uniref:hypothetical protein n=1 Tax=Rheinheimera sp. SA_1 TaxID=1827365 RepID=UPI0007FFDEFE|nr:hypothetical protein [Rheinheimera sp. SA_1]OBP15706.1 hypothetical protein A5320_10400 [Rheinheimera sp. SA_1]
MSKIVLTAALRADYQRLFDQCQINSAKAPLVEQTIQKIMNNKTRYQAVSALSGAPWYVIAVIHLLEASLNFNSHLHNGDPLTARTVQVPAGHPKKGNPPFTWEESALDALSLKGVNKVKDWSLPALLYTLESYNGMGYRIYHPHVPSPYLWGFSNHYVSGKYTHDGRWSDSAVSQQCGCAVILRRMAELDLIEFADQPVAEASQWQVHYSERAFTDPAQQAKAVALQEWLNTHPGIFVKPDGIPGRRTSDANFRISGHYLPQDPLHP